jgi:hypothetical protein
MMKYASSARRTCASSYEYVSGMTGNWGTHPASTNDSNNLAFQKIQQTLSVESLNPPDTQTREAHLSLACLAQESGTLR